MKFMTTIGTAYLALRQNLRRSILTMLGIVIGITAVITIFSLGHGFQVYTIKNLTQSSNSQNVSTEVDFIPSADPGNMSSFFDQRDLTLAEGVAGVKSAAFKKMDDSVPVGIDFNSPAGHTSKIVSLVKQSTDQLLYGRNLTAADNSAYRRVAVITDGTASEISSDLQSVIGSGIDISGMLYTVVGISSAPPAQSGPAAAFGQQPIDMEIPAKTYELYNPGSSMISAITVTVDSGYKPSEVGNAVVKVLTTSGSLTSQGTYQEFDMASVLDGISNTLSMLTFFISGIAGISLFIAGVGVMNMMYTSVSERTQEIGVRRAMGARKFDIRLQFLTEGLLLTVSSGIIGYVLGFLLAALISQFLPFKVSPDLFTIGLAIGITTLLGLIFSVAPANAAARKDLVEILR